MDSRSHEVDVLLDVLGKAIFLACNMCLTRFGMYILVILGVQKALGFGDSHIDVNPIRIGMYESPCRFAFFSQ